MFSHYVQNPTDIQKEKIYVIPFGHRCSSALACKYASLRHFSLPFDWVIPLFPQKAQSILENEFKDFIPDVQNNVFENVYGVRFDHFNDDKNAGIEEILRRIERFNIVIDSSNKIYFVYINEDFIYDPEYRTDAFNNDIFAQMLELETFLKTKYPHITYNVLYFNFKEHEIPATSNIINIVLRAETVYESFVPWAAENLRNYCGEILSSLFDTPLVLGYTHDTFIG